MPNPTASDKRASAASSDAESSGVKVDDKPPAEPTEPDAAPTPEPDVEADPEPAESRVRRFKFMGSADQRILPAGDDAGGTLPKLKGSIEFDRKNNWIVSTSDYPNVPGVWWDHLRDNESGFEEVTDSEVVPLNEHQRTFLGMQQAGEAKRVAAPTPGGAPVSSVQK